MGSNPSANARVSSTTSTAAAPSLMPLELPAVTLPAFTEDRFQTGQIGGGGSRPGMLVGGDELVPPLDGNWHGHDFSVESTFRYCDAGASLAFGGERILRVARYAATLDDVFGGFSHGVGIVTRRQLWD